MSARKRIAIAAGAASVLLEVAVLQRRGQGFGGRVAVRCRAGHVFTSHHWSLVTPV